MSRRVRVRERYSEDELAQLYGSPWVQAPTDHPHLINCRNPWARQEIAIGLGRGLSGIRSIADMSAGDATIPRAPASHFGVPEEDLLLGDLAAGYPIHGTIADTVPQLPVVDLFVCTDTLEHLDDPGEDLHLIREKCRDLLVSTPIEEWDEPSGGHYWAWDREGVEEMLVGGGFQVSAYVELDMTPWWDPHCRHGFWACR